MVWLNLRDENMKNGYLRWFGHVKRNVKRKVINATVRKKSCFYSEQKEIDYLVNYFTYFAVLTINKIGISL